MKNSKKVLALVLSLLTLIAIFTGCGSKGKDPAASQQPEESPTQKAEPVMGGDLNVGITQDLDNTLDPHKIVYAGTREMLFNVFEGLVKPDTDGTIIPAVAEKYEISDTGDVFTFTLRQGVKFHNGADVGVEDVVYSLSRAAGLDSGEPLVDGFGSVKSVEAADDKTIVVTLKEPNIEFLAMFTAAIIPKDNDPAAELVGTGPFSFSSRTPQESVVIKKFAEYWGTPAYVDSVTYKIIENSEAEVMSLKSGALDLAAHLTSAQANELGEDFTIVKGTMNLVQAVYLNNKVAPFDNVKVRQALSYAIDRQTIMDILADGGGAAVGSSMYPAFAKYYMPELNEVYPFDPEKAKSLLAEAGYPQGFEMDITVPSNYLPHMDTADVVAEQLKAVGIKVNIKLVDWETWVNDTYLGREYQSTIVGVDAANLTARAMLERFTSTAGNNFVNFNSEEYDKTFAQAIASTNEAEQTELYKKLLTILTEEAANLYIQDLCDIVAMGNGVGGYEFYPIYVMDMSKVYFTK